MLEILIILFSFQSLQLNVTLNFLIHLKIQKITLPIKRITHQ
jgi:hypothetical protein